ncbi:TIGR01244 family sulfur transferase [Lutimaribacter marinistellae]|uniref:TIGR01244 family sulfur transferase n=1 Tax=Lutimaribacter marinistellae TaxID=1820329 RepID=A0ABV7TDD2_9RHOB
MDIRPITPAYSVSPQISVDDVPAIAKAGFVRVICNRPNAEVPPSHDTETIGAACREAGLDYQVLELTHQTMTPENVARQVEMIADAGGPVLAYCASGTRSTVAWALGSAGKMSADDILTKARAAGYQIDQLRPALQAQAS